MIAPAIFLDRKSATTRFCWTWFGVQFRPGFVRSVSRGIVLLPLLVPLARGVRMPLHITIGTELTPRISSNQTMISI